MQYNECLISKDELFHITAHEHYYVNPYFGCSEACPYCYWTLIPGWEGQISARMNVAEVFKEAMQTWDNSCRICFGSYCNPYESIESRYRLTRSLLEIVKKYEVPFMLTTSSELILDDAQLIASMKDQAIIVFELSRIKRLVDFQKTGEHPVLDAANQLSRMGVNVLTTLSPYLKGITEIDSILSYLDKEIPIYLGELDLTTNFTTAGRLLPQIAMHKPEVLQHYGWVIKGDNALTEFENVMKQYDQNPRIKRFPLDIQYKNCKGGKGNG